MISKSIKIFIESLKNLRINIVFLVFWDVISYAFFIYIPFLITKYLMTRPVISEMLSVEGGVESLTPEQIMRFTPMLGSFLFQGISLIILTILLLYFVYSISRCFIWSQITQRKLDWKYLFDMVKLNAIWIPFVLIISFGAYLVLTLFVIMLRSLRSAFIFYTYLGFVLAVVLAIVTLNFLVYYYFSIKNKIFLSMGAAFGVFRKFHKLILPLVYMAVVLYLVLLPYNLLTYKVPGFSQNYSIIQVLILTIYLAWMRMYVVRLVKKEE